MKKFEFIEGATADVLFKAYGENLSKAFENSAIAFFEVITDTRKVKPLIEFNFTKKSQDLLSLLYDFLEELLYIHKTKQVLLSKFKVVVNSKDFSLKAVAYGEAIKKTHELRHDIKAITYSRMSIKKTRTGYVIEAVPDI